MRASAYVALGWLLAGGGGLVGMDVASLDATPRPSLSRWVVDLAQITPMSPAFADSAAAGAAASGALRGASGSAGSNASTAPASDIPPTTRNAITGGPASFVAAATSMAVAGSLNRSALQPNEVPRGLASAWLADNGLPLAAIETSAELDALRVTSWREGPVERLQLTGLAGINIGSYNFRAEQATVWLQRVRQDGRRVNLISIYLEGIFDANRPSGVSVAGRELLITVKTIGPVRLRSDRFIEGVPEFDAFQRRAESRLAGHLNSVAARRTQRDPDAVAAGDLTSPLQPPASEVVKPEVIRIEPIAPELIPSQPESPGRAATDRPRVRAADPAEQTRDGVRRIGDRIEWPGEVEPGMLIAEGPTPLVPDADGGRLEFGTSDEPGAVRPPQATLLFRFDDLEYQFAGAEGDRAEEGAAILTGGIVVQYHELRPRPGERERRSLTLTADRAVVFTDPIEVDQIATGQLDADNVRGAYLEGNVVATDGEYTMRGVRMFYDFRTNRAILLEGVLHTYVRDRRTPLYARADVIRQKAVDAWEAENVTLSTSEFFVPHIGIGASKIEITEQPVPRLDGETRLYADARNTTVELGGTPIFWWPLYDGPAEDIPIREVSFSQNDYDGLVFQTTWDFFSLIGREAPGRVDADLKVDYYTKRGLGGGIDFDWRGPGRRGSFNNYFIDDSGTDKLSSGAEIDRDGDFRSVLDFRHFQRLPGDWTLIAEFGHVSDPAFYDAYFEEEAETGRPLVSRAYLKQQRDNWAFDIVASYDFDNIISVHDELQTPGYEVERVPELGYYRYADRLFDNALSYSSEWRYGRVRFSFPDFKVEEIG
ncbi:MAG: hypothetical protein ACOC0P_07540, partial [Planctomycetota bacterium]